MILGIGTDIVDVARFEKWAGYSHTRLLKIFSEQELAQCKHDNLYIPEKLAARFAAKEAFYKALSASLVTLKKTEKTFSLLSTARFVTVAYAEWGVPYIVIDWQSFAQKNNIDCLPLLSVHLSLAHEKSHALAFVVIIKAQ